MNNARDFTGCYAEHVAVIEFQNCFFCKKNASVSSEFSGMSQMTGLSEIMAIVAIIGTFFTSGASLVLLAC